MLAPVVHADTHALERIEKNFAIEQGRGGDAHANANAAATTRDAEVSSMRGLGQVSFI